MSVLRNAGKAQVTWAMNVESSLLGVGRSAEGKTNKSKSEERHHEI